MSVAASSLAELFDFEGQFEKAAQAILQTSGVNAYVTQSRQQLPLINTGIDFNVSAAIDQLTFLPLAPGQTTPTEQEYFRYDGTLELTVEVPRDTARSPSTAAVSFLAQSRALIRAAFMRSQWPFQDSNLPYYRVSNIMPSGTIDGFDQTRNVDSSILRFTITFAIQPTAWPTGFPPS